MPAFAGMTALLLIQSFPSFLLCSLEYNLIHRIAEAMITHMRRIVSRMAQSIGKQK